MFRDMFLEEDNNYFNIGRKQRDYTQLQVHI